MKTIRFERVDLQVPPLIGNPFMVCSRGLHILTPGHTAVLRTGVKVEIPENSQVVVHKNMMGEQLVILGVTCESDKEIEVIAVSVPGADMSIIQQYKPLAMVEIVGFQSPSLRFIEYSGGKRQANYGDSSKISIDNFEKSGEKE